MTEHLDSRDLQLLLEIRHFEHALLRLFERGDIDGTTHTCLGQEHVPVALRPLLIESDVIFSNHRGHGHFLARFGDPVALLAEIMGRRGGVCEGVGGSQHLHRPGYFSTGVQGESLPVAVGVALHLKRRGEGALALAYIGDGTFGEGGVYEALNMAGLWGVPLVVVVENNGIAQTTPVEFHLAGTVQGRAAAFGLDYHRVTSNEVGPIRADLGPLLRRVRERGRPLVVEFEVVRIGPHSKGDDTRDQAWIESLAERDWRRLYERDFPDQFTRVDARARDVISAAIAEVTSRPPAPGIAA